MADNMDAVFSKRGGAVREVIVPRPVPRLCSRRVLTMEHVRGRPFLSVIHATHRAAAEAMGMEYEEMMDKAERAIKDGGVTVNGEVVLKVAHRK